MDSAMYKSSRLIGIIFRTISNVRITKAFIATLLLCASFRSAFAIQTQAPSDIKISAVARAEKYLREIERLSPSIDLSARDRSQLWPRNPQLIRKLRDQDGQIIIDRPKTITVTSYGEPTVTGWRVKYYGGEIELNLDLSTKRVRMVVDSVIVHAIENDPAPLPENCISDNTALYRALSYLRAGSIDTDTLLLKRIWKSDMSNPPQSAADRITYVDFCRHWSGVPYFDENLSVGLDAGKGRLIGYGGASLTLELPSNTNINISAEQAVQIALNKSREMGLTPLNGSYASLIITLPSDFVGGEGRGNTPYLCWNVYVPVEFTAAGTSAQVVRVNVSTGEMVGGHQYRSRGGPITTLPDPAIMKLLAQAKELQITGSDGNSTTLVLKPSAMKFRYFGALNGFTWSKLAESKVASSHNITVVPTSGKPTSLIYDSKSGVLKNEAGKGVIVSRPMQAILIGK